VRQAVGVGERSIQLAPGNGIPSHFDDWLLGVSKMLCEKIPRAKICMCAAIRLFYAGDHLNVAIRVINRTRNCKLILGLPSEVDILSVDLRNFG